MKKLIYREGNLLTSREIVCCAHQANCQNTFGSGIARSIREMYPVAYDADCSAARAKVNTLGRFSVGYIPTDNNISSISRIYNLYGQNLYGKGTRQTNYDALYSALEGMVHDLTENDMSLPVPSVGFPFQMGSFRGGGNWDIVSRLIEVAFDGYANDVIVYRLDMN
jgi:O-acetyl-ADP-ribose deacetylase (regulator of RNase III)